ALRDLTTESIQTRNLLENRLDDLTRQLTVGEERIQNFTVELTELITHVNALSKQLETLKSEHSPVSRLGPPRRSS
ncbi:MAG: hypothetical protein L0Z50_38490, partial [Verrucomicrobiales bacterium]|nr:hypothetical protein [Verrucomicrobiales bacterium]